MQQQPVEQVGRAALRLADDVEERQAAQAKQLAISATQVPLEVTPQVVAHRLETPRAQREEVFPVGISGGLRGELLVPAGALDAGQEAVRDDGKQLQRGTERGESECRASQQSSVNHLQNQESILFVAQRSSKGLSKQTAAV